MIKTKGVLFLNGDFRKAQPTHDVYTVRDGDRWTLVRCGPRYSNTFEVVDFDAEGLRKLESLERKPGEGPT